MRKSHFLKGTLILTVTGFLSRIIGFFFRILLSRTIGADGIGIYQLIFPIQGLLLAFTSGGIQTSISRFTAAKYAKNDRLGAIQSFLTGTTLSLFLSVFTAALLYQNSGFFGAQILKEARTVPLLAPLALSIPFSALHGCINSYYYGLTRTALPSAIQLLEQAVRVLSVCLICQILLSEGRPVTPAVAVYGILISEIIAVLCSLFAIAFHLKKNAFSFRSIRHLFQSLQEILSISVPITTNRVLLTLLSSIEVVLIPQRLQLYGLDTSEALSVYGIFTGMALPLILFPTTVTHSAATMLLPSIAELQALGQKSTIRRVVNQIWKLCFLLGTFFGIFFFLFGNPVGLLLFGHPEVGTYLRVMSFICPFLYMNTTLSSVLNGLGKPGICLIHNIIVISIRIFFVLVFVPVKGIQGYLWGILAGELTMTALTGFALLGYSRKNLR